MSSILRSGYRALATLLATALLSSGCHTPEDVCTNSDPLWLDHFPSSDPAVDVVKVGVGGKISLNDKPISRAGLTQYWQRWKVIDPSPVTLLRHDAGAECGDVSAIRELMRANLDCSDEGRKCAEGTQWDWVRNTGVRSF